MPIATIPRAVSLKIVGAIAAVSATATATTAAPPDTRAFTRCAEGAQPELLTPAAPFVSLSTTANIPIDIVIRPGPPAVTLCSSSDLREHLTVAVARGTLSVAGTGSYRTRRGERLLVEMPTLATVGSSDSARIVVQGGDGPLAVAVNGSGSIVVESSDHRFSITQTGSGRVDLSRSARATGSASLTGSGALVLATDADMKISNTGSGRVVQSGRRPAR